MLDDLLKGFQARLKAFIEDPQRRALFVRVDPDIELMAGKVLADAGGKDTGAIALGVSGDLSKPAALFVEASKELSDFVAELAKELSSDEQEVIAPAPLPASPPPSVEQFAAFLEQVGRTLAGHFAHTLVAMRFDEVGEPKATIDLLGRLLAAASLPQLKIAILDDRPQPRFVPFEVTPSPRYGLASPEDLAMSDPSAIVHNLVTRRPERVLGLSGSPGRLEAIRRIFEANPRQVPGVATVVISGEMRGRAQFADLVLSELRKRVPDGTSISLPPNIYDQRALFRPEQTLAELVERLRPVLAGENETLCVALAPTKVQVPPRWQEFVLELSAAAISPRVRYLALEPAGGDAPLPPTPTGRRRWEVDEFTMPVAELEKDLHVELGKPNLDPGLKVQYAIALGNMHIARKEFGPGFKLLSEALGTSEETGRADQQTMAWSSIGDALLRSEQYPLSRNAFAQATSLALDTKSDVAAARALMGMGHTHFLEGDFPSALKAYTTAFTYWEAAGNVFGCCDAQSWQAECWRHLGDVQRAETLLHEVIGVYQAIGVPLQDMAQQGLGEAFQRLAALYRQAGRRDLADQCVARAKALGREWPAPEKPT